MVLVLRKQGHKAGNAVNSIGSMDILHSADGVLTLKLLLKEQIIYQLTYISIFLLLQHDGFQGILTFSYKLRLKLL